MVPLATNGNIDKITNGAIERTPNGAIVGAVVSLSPTGSSLLHTGLSPLTNGIWEIHAVYTCFVCNFKPISARACQMREIKMRHRNVV